MSTPTLAPPGIAEAAPADIAPDLEEYPAAAPASEEDSATSPDPDAEPDADSETDSESLTASGHARPGYLRMQVARVLADAPETEMKVGDVARILGNSGGAIGNALDRLVELGQAVQTSKAPRRWQANAETEKAAGTATIARGSGPATPASGGATAPAPPKAAKAAPSRPEPITRPNGQQYHPRALGKHTDVIALRTLREAGVPALLYGPPGTGKTSVIEAAFDDLITIAGDGDTTVGDFIHRAELHRIRYSSPGDPGADVQDQGIGCRRALPVGAGFESLRNQFNDVALYATWRELLISRARRTCCSLTGSSTWTRRRRCSTR